MRIIALFALVSLFSSCRSAPAEPSSLQRFDGLRHQLASVSSASVSVASDMRSIEARMEGADGPGARRAALRLGRDARRLSQAARTASARLRPISLGESSAGVRQYFRATLATLDAESLEGHVLLVLSASVREDPLLLTRRDLHAFVKIVADARVVAETSVYQQQRALRFRRKYGALFRYIPVPAAPGSG